MKTTELINKHYQIIELLERLQWIELKINTKTESVNGFSGTFPDLRKKYLKIIELNEYAIDKLTIKYNNLLNN